MDRVLLSTDSVTKYLEIESVVFVLLLIFLLWLFCPFVMITEYILLMIMPAMKNNGTKTDQR